MANLTKFLALSSIVLLASCAKTENKAPNEILTTSAPETKAYKDELAALLEKADTTKLEYYFDHYAQKNGKEYLYVAIEGAVEATAVVTVNQWDENLKDIHESKGKGYAGSELKNLKFDVERDSASTSFIYKSMDGLSD